MQLPPPRSPTAGTSVMNGANNRDLGHEGTFLNISVQEVVLTPEGDKLGILYYLNGGSIVAARLAREATLRVTARDVVVKGPFEGPSMSRRTARDSWSWTPTPRTRRSW